ncbi:MAG: phosphoadenosine phosphosulfate reductase family protein [Tannerellaceae bacterium]|nr:phosphoadenosine phosphosulfate reductase family protein [Tannerellaceae bacterium]
MYAYTWDTETGGLLLNNSQLQFSKEPRPVYYQELDLLGFDRFWSYDKDDSQPYMWAETNSYIYKGRHVASLNGGSLYTAPTISIIKEPEPEGQKLQQVDIKGMIAKNEVIFDSLVKDTIKKIYNTYLEFRKKVQVFHVSFSGGKDSEVTLDLVQRALPHNDFLVIFGDTEMEFSDTYRAVEQAKIRCEEENIKFYTARSHFKPKDSWRRFGPPGSAIRWCCSVHKTTPQLLLLRDILGKNDFSEMAFVGVRRDESARRSGYDYTSRGTKHKGQWSCNPILDWNSAEVYLYIYKYNLYLNKAYTKGLSRAGCLVCPMAASKK